MGTLSMRRVEPADRDSVHWIAASTGVIAPSDLEAALALVDAGMSGGDENGCPTHLLEDGGVPVGFVCFGPVPRTQGTWQLHAIAVEGTGHGKGFGRHLLAFAEAEARHGGGRLLLAESSTHEAESGLGSFYERTGYSLLAQIPGFYRPGDDKLVYGKVLEREAPPV